MLRIERTANGKMVFFTLSGRIGESELGKLKSLIKSESKDRHIILDLENVTIVDLNTVRSLDRLELARIELVNAPAYIRAWIETERGQPRRERKEGAFPRQRSK